MRLALATSHSTLDKTIVAGIMWEVCNQMLLILASTYTNGLAVCIASVVPTVRIGPLQCLLLCILLLAVMATHGDTPIF